MNLGEVQLSCQSVQESHGGTEINIGKKTKLTSKLDRLCLYFIEMLWRGVSGFNPAAATLISHLQHWGFADKSTRT